MVDSGAFHMTVCYSINCFTCMGWGGEGREETSPPSFSLYEISAVKELLMNQPMYVPTMFRSASDDAPLCVLAWQCLECLCRPLHGPLERNTSEVSPTCVLFPYLQSGNETVLF